MERKAKNGLPLELQIDELVLHGFAPGERFAVADALESELAELFAEQVIGHSMMRSTELSGLDGGEFRVASGSGPQQIGAQIGQSVYRRLMADTQGPKKTSIRAEGERSHKGIHKGD